MTKEEITKAIYRGLHTLRSFSPSHDPLDPDPGLRIVAARAFAERVSSSPDTAQATAIATEDTQGRAAFLSVARFLRPEDVGKALESSTEKLAGHNELAITGMWFAEAAQAAGQWLLERVYHNPRP